MLPGLFETGNFISLSKKILFFIQNRERLINKSKAAKNYLNRFDFKKNSKKFEDLFKSLSK